jgi:hypothetical protein
MPLRFLYEQRRGEACPVDASLAAHGIKVRQGVSQTGARMLRYRCCHAGATSAMALPEAPQEGKYMGHLAR